MNTEALKVISKELKPAPGVILAKGMQTPLDDKNSRWRYSMDLANFVGRTFRVVLFTGGINHNRIARVSFNGTNYVYPDVDGNKTIFENNAENEIIVPDNPLEINYCTNLEADIVATNFVQGGTNPQTYLYNRVMRNDFSFDSKKNSGLIDELRNFLSCSPLKLKEIQITSTNEVQFSSDITYGQFNPLEKFQSERIAISDYYEAQSNRKKVVIEKEIILNSHSIMTIDIPNLTQTQLTFVFSSTFSLGEFFKRKNRYENILKSLL